MELKAVLFFQYSRLALTRLVLGSAAHLPPPVSLRRNPRPRRLRGKPCCTVSRAGMTASIREAGLIFGKDGALYGTTYLEGP